MPLLNNRVILRIQSFNLISEICHPEFNAHGFLLVWIDMLRFDAVWCLITTLQIESSQRPAACVLL